MGKLELNKKQKQDALYNAAFDLFITKGAEKTTISDITEKAGVAKGTFYLYFADKEDIKNKLIHYKTNQLFFKAHNYALNAPHETMEDFVFNFVDHILDILEADRPLLSFLSRDLSWGLIRAAMEEILPDLGMSHYYALLHFFAQKGHNYSNPEFMLFTIIELVTNTGYRCIMTEQPAPFSEYRPYLHKAIRGILKSFEC